MFSQAADAIFAQDKPILEAQQRLVGEQDIFDLKPVSFSGDLLPIEARRILSRLIKAQNADRAADPPVENRTVDQPQVVLG
jgi:vanillate O-demethylase monooxygenase subunit